MGPALCQPCLPVGVSRLEAHLIIQHLMSGVKIMTSVYVLIDDWYRGDDGYIYWSMIGVKAMVGIYVASHRLDE